MTLGEMELMSGPEMGSEFDVKSIKKKKKKKKKKRKRETDEVNQDAVEDRGEGTEKKKKKKKRKREADEVNQDAVENRGKGTEKKKAKKTVRFQEPIAHDVEEKNAVYMPREKDSNDDVALSLDRSWRKDSEMPGLRYGRFTKEEDQKIKESVFAYIKMRGWDEKEGLEIVMNASQDKHVKGCWRDIANCLPIRPMKQLYTRARRILGGFTEGRWSKEELEALKTLHDRHGNDWRKIALHINRSGVVVKDRWRRMRLEPVVKRGFWGQEEYDKLLKLVRRSLRVKQSIPAKLMIDHREIRDNINWEWIAEEMQRDSARCCEAWYEKLASPMIVEKKWANEDDHLLLQRLMELGAASEEVIDWDVVLDHRDGECCTRRWKEMTRLLGNSDHIPFEDKVELLAKRYAPDLLGIEET